MAAVVIDVPGHGVRRVVYNSTQALTRDAFNRAACAESSIGSYDMFDIAAVIGSRCRCPCARTLALVCVDWRPRVSARASWQWATARALEEMVAVDIGGGVTLHLKDDAVWQLARSVSDARGEGV